MSTLSYIVDALRAPSTKQWWPWIIATPFLIVLFEYLAVAPIGSFIFLWLEIPFMIASLAAVIAIPVLPFIMIIRKRRATALAWWLAALCYLPLLFGGLFIGKKIRNSAFVDLANRSAPLVAGIHKYSDDHGSPPESLGDLVPKYISEIPETGIMAYSEYRYEVGDLAERYEGNPWILRVFTPSGGINFDEFMYFPLNNYPDHGHGGSFERIGDWAYLHE